MDTSGVKSSDAVSVLVDVGTGDIIPEVGGLNYK